MAAAIKVSSRFSRYQRLKINCYKSYVKFFCSSQSDTDTNTIENDPSRFPETIFSGIQPTGGIHLGNYFGAIKRWVDLQNQGKKTIYSIVDLHSLTVLNDPEILRSNIYELAACLLACGINPDKSIFFIQSQVSEHTQLAWILSCLASIARLNQLPQYKDKLAKTKKTRLGLLSYPVLQSADILLYRATHVPVGEDQIQHLQIARRLARKFNDSYGVSLFPSPIPLISEGESARLKSLRSPDKKMSKSEENPLSRIDLLDPPDVITEKLKKAVTDCTSAVTFDPESRPGVSNLITIHSLVTGKTSQEICKDSENVDTGQYKRIVADAIIQYMDPIRKRMLDYLKDPHYVTSVLSNGAEKATVIAKETWERVKHSTGLLPAILEENAVKKRWHQ